MLASCQQLGLSVTPELVRLALHPVYIPAKQSQFTLSEQNQLSQFAVDE